MPTLNRKEVIDPAEMRKLMGLLRQKDGSTRKKARLALERIGAPAEPFLTEALSDRREYVRWEAVRALADIREPASASALVRALMDDSFDVSWVAADGLIRLKSAALIPLLHAITEHFDSASFRRGAQHVLEALDEEGLLSPPLARVLAALRNVAAEFAVLSAADEALSYLKKGPALTR